MKIETINSEGGVNRIIFLDYLRIFSFVSVLIGHKFYDYVFSFSNDPAVHATPRLIANLLLPFFYGGGAGVVVFFLISGYIVAHVLQTDNAIEFLIKRAFRIYPLYFFAVMLEYILHALNGHAQPLSTLIPQLLLIGDFFGTPYSLSGVEWTLRIEALFYLFMAAVRSLQLTTIRVRLLPYLFATTVIVCGFISPIPSADVWSKGYLTIYVPFLFLGSMIYFFEGRKIGLTLLLLFIGLVFYSYYTLIVFFQPRWLNSHFAMLAFFVFLVFWIFRDYLESTRYILFLSNLTYAVYLFHNWLFNYFKLMLTNLGVSIINMDIQALIVLFLFSFMSVKYIERPGIKLGHAMLKMLR
jgi:peptidoglycan/LPS O-acetylase OafA/YrhL